MGYVFAFLGVLMLMISILQPNTTQNNEINKAKVSAMNYLLYREAVHTFTLSNKNFTGKIEDSALELPTDFIKQDWFAFVQGNICYVYGIANDETKNITKDFFKGSHAIGENRNGVFYPNYNDKNFTLPNFVPNDALVSVMELVP